MVQLRKKRYWIDGPRPRFSANQRGENLSAPPKLESRPTCRDWNRDVFEAFFDPNPQLRTPQKMMLLNFAEENQN